MNQRIFIDHYTAEADGVDTKLLNDPEELTEVVTSIAKDLKLTIVNKFIHKFKPYGLSLILIISESHLAIHTWPEFGYLHLDILSCSKDTNLKNLKEVLEKYLKTEKVEIKQITS